MKSGAHTAICYGEILWDVLPDGPQPGGAPLNVAYHLNKMGIDTSLISRIGNDSNGRKLLALMDLWGIDKNLVQTDEQHETSQVLARMGNGNEVSYEIVYPVAWDFIGKAEELNELNNYFVYGSLASRNDTSRDTLFTLLDTPAIKVFDINLRPPFINRSLLEVLLGKADIVKFNEAELDMVQVMFKGSYEAEASKIKFIQAHFDIPEVIVTKGEFGASYYKGDEAHHIWGSEIKVTDTIGSGDSFLAAFIANHSKGLQPREILKNAVAMGGFIATKKGGCPQYQLSEYIEFKNQIFKP
ncbi:carbohydrate kinase family protein [Pedobacter psychroterrae]|uniref:Carbohydrate kinase n=1 Tax=Pedobacter psychroterrae TaxID=2530453 RepID=A0A4R0NU34_9SPHI|nr:carbohydrate kinase [Pedobacter psychroterrae]TCD03483.1 carbohydrate kinase [Pedobacter psychroterrae]